MTSAPPRPIRFLKRVSFAAIGDGDFLLVVLFQPQLDGDMLGDAHVDRSRVDECLHFHRLLFGESGVAERKHRGNQSHGSDCSFFQ
jgi:hypothetical protein